MQPNESKTGATWVPSGSVMRSVDPDEEFVEELVVVVSISELTQDPLVKIKGKAH